MPVTDAMQKLIINNGTEVDIAEQAYADGLVDLRRAGILKAMQGITTLEEILASTND